MDATQIPDKALAAEARAGKIHHTHKDGWAASFAAHLHFWRLSRPYLVLVNKVKLYVISCCYNKSGFRGCRSNLHLRQLHCVEYALHRPVPMQHACCLRCSACEFFASYL